MDQMGKPEFNDAVEGAMRELSGGEGGSGSGGLPGIVNPFAAGTAGVPPPPPNAVDKSVAQALDMMAGMSRPAEGVDPAATEAMGEDVMKAMMEQFERMGEKVWICDALCISPGSIADPPRRFSCCRRTSNPSLTI